MTVSFHTMSYPTARLVWHCTYFCLFSSSNGQPDGGNYHEYLFLKLNGEKRETSKSLENQVSVILTDSFKGWKTWMEQNKQGLDCTVNIRREGSRIIMQTENAGVILNSVTTLPDDAKDVYLSLTGDQCAISNIRIKR